MSAFGFVVVFKKTISNNFVLSFLVLNHPLYCNLTRSRTKNNEYIAIPSLFYIYDI